MNKTVIIYTTPQCTFCHTAKDFFDKNKITYEEYDVATDQIRREEMIKLTGQMGVPVIKVGDDVVVGFDADKLKELLK